MASTTEDTDQSSRSLIPTGTSNIILGNLVDALAYCAIPVCAELFFGGLGLLWKPGGKFVSGVQHLSAGVVTAAVLFELGPLFLSQFNRSTYNYVATIMGFSIGFISLSVIKIFLPDHDDDDDDDDDDDNDDNDDDDDDDDNKVTVYKTKPSQNNNKRTNDSGHDEDSGEDCNERENNGSNGAGESVEERPLLLDPVAIKENPAANTERCSNSFLATFKALPWSFLLPVGVDTFLDGVLLGLACVAGTKTGLIVALAFAFETAILGMLTTTTLQHKHFSRTVAIATAFIMAGLFVLGALLGTPAFSASGSGPVFLGVISFGIATLLFLVVDDLLPEAREKKSAATWYTKIMFYLGVLAVLIIDVSTD